MIFPKKKTYRNKRYLDYIRSQICLATGSRNNIVAHHVRLGQNGGLGLKPSDYRCVPLTDYQHKKLHSIGEKTFYEKLDMNHDEEIAHYLLNYLTDRIHKDQGSDIDYRKLVPHLEDAIDSIDS